MAEVANYSVAPTDSDDTDWNWTRPVETDPAWSSGFHVSVIFALSVLILAGTLVNLVTVVTHLQTVYQLLVIATNRNGPTTDLQSVRYSTPIAVITSSNSGLQ